MSSEQFEQDFKNYAQEITEQDLQQAEKAARSHDVLPCNVNSKFQMIAYEDQM